MPKKLALDETVATVWNHLTHQRSYVSGVRAKMLQCEKQHGNAHVRIGIKGTGQKPYYRVFYIASDEAEHIFNSYYDNHQEMEEGFAITHNWSAASMSLEEISSFLAEKVNWKGSLK